MSIAAAILVSLVAPLPTESPAAAATASDFDPSYIISDANFYDGKALDAVGVQTILSRLGASCKPTATLACLKDYSTTSGSRNADPMCAAFTGRESESAASIITRVGEACGISQKALIALLEKEQSLVTRATPSATAYRSATGFACPDTAACDARYYGFFNQVYMAAWQFKRYSNPPGTNKTFTWFQPGSVSQVQYSPDARCGSSPVAIKNAATAALYYYTPYQPNAAALNNLYGAGDACSAYGNRNFWRLFSDWFGSPTSNPNISIDTVSASWGQIRVTGWAKGALNDDPRYLWINVDGVGQPYLANQPLSWFPVAFAGYSPQHGLDATISATPGEHEVCIFDAETSVIVRCSLVRVPRGAGALDSVDGVPGGARITGWSADALVASSSFIWVNVDGAGGPHRTNTRVSWLPTYLPGASADQGFDLVVNAPPGTREICVHGVEALLGCKTVEVPWGSGHLDSAEGTPGQIVLNGWYVDYTQTQSSRVWVNVDGSGKAYSTNKQLSWLAQYLPGFGTGHGYTLEIPARKGSHTVCVYGVANATLTGCATTTVPYSAAGALDTVTAEQGKIRVVGWSADLTTSGASWVWINVDGVGGPYRADRALSWFEILYPGRGTEHGYDVTIPAAKGGHEVCVYGAESQLIACKKVTVP
ncbi:hypothetical protein [Salinibacterium sp. ZJ77]|uniref:hypothetical protein n=1 Tax=Salinibacterium sp. ZJ77 TaxID=2708337 RepID=UPI001FBA0D98|nr:hypothetical protein [Salinibacterium sp. ZJ77]